MDAGKRTVNDIFNGNRVLEIPFFQRSYVWGEAQWERLLKDMEIITEANRPYFLGSVILKQKTTTSSSEVGDIRSVIDGQQRLTTLNIFFKVLCLKTGKNSSFDRRFRLESEKLALWHNHNDIEAFEKVLSLDSLDELSNKDRITQAYNYFRNNLDSDKVDRQRLLNNITFVGIDLGKEEDEQQIFDTINSLGVRLTTAELLKNHLFDRDDLSLYNTYWKDVFEKDEATKNYWDQLVTTGRVRRTLIDLFFYAFLQIKAQDPELDMRSEDKSDFSRVDALFESYKKFFAQDVVEKEPLLQEVQSYAKAFRDNFDYEIIHKALPQEAGMERINAIIFGMETSTLIPYVLYVLRNVEDENQRNELFGFLEAFIMRRVVTKSTTKNYNQFFTDRLISNQILSKGQLISYLEGQNDKINNWPTDEDLLHGFRHQVLINRQAAGVIYFLESKLRNYSRQATQLLGLKKYSLEHLMPKKWERKWAKPADQEAINERNHRLKTLGNLAIITQSLNAAIRDSNWPTKKRGQGRKGGLKDYSAGIETLAPYLESEVWDVPQIEERAQMLYGAALKYWAK